jgi:hypothetical protein
VAQVIYNRTKDDMAEAYLSGKTLKMLLLKTTVAGCYDPDIDTVAALISAGGVRCDFTNYTDKTLASLTSTEDDTNDRANVDAASVTWTAAGGATNNTPVAAVIYNATTDTNDTTRILIGYYDTNFGSVATNGGDYTVNINDFLRLA